MESDLLAGVRAIALALPDAYEEAGRGSAPAGASGGAPSPTC